MEDKLLVLKCKQGNRDGVRLIYEKYRDYLLISAVVLLNDINAAEDTVHDVFVKFAENVKDFKLKGSLRAYLATCVANNARNKLRSKQYQLTSLDQYDFGLTDSNNLEESVICNEELRQLSTALADISQKQRDVIVLHIYNKMSFRAIAALEEVSVNTIKSRYRYGIGKLREMSK